MYLLKYIFFMFVFFFFLSCIISYSNGYIGTYIGQCLLKKFRLNVFHHVQNIRLEDKLNMESGDFIAKINDDTSSVASCVTSTFQFTNVVRENQRKVKKDIFYEACVKIDNDIVLYKSLAKKYGNKVLDLGCGSGRITLPLLKEGCKVTAVDMSEDMLDILKKKADSENLRIVKGDMCDIDLQEKYNLAILPVSTIMLIKDKEKLLKNVYKCLEQGGVFAFCYNDYSCMPRNQILKPITLFGKEKKSFCIMTEKINFEDGISNENLYLEDVDDNSDTKRYITAVEKNIINKEEMERLIEVFNFKEVQHFAYDVGEYDMLYRVLIKI